MQVQERHCVCHVVCCWVGTRPTVVSKMLQLAQVGAEDVVCDLGCGDGRILIAAVKDFGAEKGVGYEAREELYEGAMRNIERHGLEDRIIVTKGDMFDADLTKPSVITLYLSNEANELLRPKLEKETKCGTRIVSHHFPITNWRIASKKAAGYCAGVAIYLYVTPEAFS